MRKITLLFAALLSLWGGTIKAETLTETFDDVTVTSRYLLSNGWVMVHNGGNYQGFGGSYDYQIKSGNYDGETGNSLFCDYSDNNEYVVIPTKLCGTFTYYVKRSSSSNGTVTFFEATKDGDTFTVTTTQLATTSTSSSWDSQKSFNIGDEGKYVAIRLLKSRIDQISATVYEQASGPALTVKDGSTKLTSPATYNFGLATAGTEKVITLSNPGTADLGVSVSETGNFGATLSATTISAGSEVSLTLTMPTATSSSEVTITPADGSGIDPFVINVSGTIRDANKVYERGFTALPEDWTTTGSWYYSAANGAYTTVWYLTSNARLITPLLTISEGETFFVEAKGYSTSNTSYQHLQMQYSADGTTWTNFGDEPTLDPSEWNTFAFTGAPAGKYYIAINASQADVRMFYGGQLPQEPKMVVTQPAFLDFGVITEATSKTFTIANTGKAELKGITVTSSNSSIFSITGAPTSLAAGASADVTITMVATTTGALSSDITVSATDMEDVEFTVTGIVLPEGMMVVDFNDNALPARWGNNASNKWSFADGKAYCTSAAELTTPRLQFADGDMLAIKVTSYDDYDNNYIEITGSADGSTWDAFTAKKYVSRSQIPYGSYATIVVTDIPTATKYLKIKGYYVRIDEIAGLTYAAELAVTENGAAVSTPASYDFGEAAADATVTYNFANAGAGSINITNVAITGESAAAYSTNWTESVAVPFDFVITRSYDASREGASKAVVTVTTTEGEFVINVTGTDKAANAPELAVSPAEDAVFGVVTAAAEKTYTVTNAGTGVLTVNIASDNAMFTVAPAQLADIAAGESATFKVTFTPVAETYGAFSATVTVTPTYDESAVATIVASAKVKDPNVWSEDFADGKPAGWETGSNWTIANGVAKAAYAYGTTNYLTTPTLTVTDASDELTFDYKATANYVSVKIQMSKDGAAFADYNTISGLNNGDAGTYTITGLEAGEYQFRFANDDYELDNFEGFKLNLAEHIMSITASNIPTSLKATVSFNATVTVTEKRGVDEENVVAKLYMGDTVIGTSEAVTVEANSTQQITISATPTTAATEGAEMYIEVTYAGGTLKTDNVNRTVAEFTTLALDETQDNSDRPEGEYSATTYDRVTLTYTVKAGWNTVALPFSVTDLSIFGEGVKAYKYDGFDGEGYLKFSTATTLTYAEPYILYVETPATGDFVFNELNVYGAAPSNIKSTWNFVGTYAPKTAGSLKGMYGVTGEGKIQKAGENATMKAFRAYFEPNLNYDVKGIVFMDGETAVRTLSADSREAQEIFDLMGRKQSNAQKGISIVNGKKVVRK